MLNDKEAIETLIKMISELDVLYARTREKLGNGIIFGDVNTLCEKFYGTELGDALKPLKNADTLLGEVNPLVELYIKGVLDVKEFMRRFEKLSKTRLANATINGLIDLAAVYMNAYSSPLNSLEGIAEVLNARFANPEIQPC